MTARSDAIRDDDGDAAAPELAEEKGPLRRCIATGAVTPKDGMIRFAVAPDGALVPDLEERLPGRGLWLSADSAAIAKAVQKNLFSKAARRSVRVPADLPLMLTRLLERRCLDHIGLARRAGQALAGFEKVRESLKSGHVGRGGPAPGLLIEAADGSPEQRGKVTALAPDIPVVDAFVSADLAAALGRGHAVHAVIAHGRLADALQRDACRLAGIRSTQNDAGGSPPAGQGNNV